MPFVPDGRGQYVKIKNVNYMDCNVILKGSAVCGEVPLSRLTEADKVHIDARGMVAEIGETRCIDGHRTERRAKARLAGPLHSMTRLDSVGAIGRQRRGGSMAVHVVAGPSIQHSRA